MRDIKNEVISQKTNKTASNRQSDTHDTAFYLILNQQITQNLNSFFPAFRFPMNTIKISYWKSLDSRKTLLPYIKVDSSFKNWSFSFFPLGLMFKFLADENWRFLGNRWPSYFSLPYGI